MSHRAPRPALRCAVAGRTTSPYTERRPDATKPSPDAIRGSKCGGLAQNGAFRFRAASRHPYQGRAGHGILPAAHHVPTPASLPGLCSLLSRAQTQTPASAPRLRPSPSILSPAPPAPSGLPPRANLSTIPLPGHLAIPLPAPRLCYPVTALRLLTSCPAAGPALMPQNPRKCPTTGERAQGMHQKERGECSGWAVVGQGNRVMVQSPLSLRERGYIGVSYAMRPPSMVSTWPVR